MRRQPAGRWGVWLVAQREARGRGQTETFMELRHLFGWGESSRASYSDWEYGVSAPNADQQALLLAFYKGAEPPPESNSEGVHRDGDALAALYEKLDAQADAINALARQVEALVGAQSSAGAATADLVAVAIHETLRAAGLVAGLPPQ